MSTEIKYTSEKDIAFPTNVLSIQNMEKLLEIGEKKVCKMKCGERKGTGFFCNIIIDDCNLLRTLITNGHLLNEEDIKPGKKICFSMSDDEQYHEIKIDNERKIYLSDVYDVTIIEIKKEDNIKSDSFFEIDDNINNPEYDFKNKPIYLLHYPGGNEFSFSSGIIKSVDINETNHEIYHTCDSANGSAGGPLINSLDFKVIGIHNGYTKYNLNYGTLLKEPIIEFKNKIKNKENIIKDNKKKIVDNIEEKKVEIIDNEKKDNFDELK